MLKYKNLFLSSPLDIASLCTSQRKIKINQLESLKLIRRPQNTEVLKLEPKPMKQQKTQSKRGGVQLQRKQENESDMP